MVSHSVDAALSTGLHRPTRRLLKFNEAHCRDLARFFQNKILILQLCPGRGSFALSHSGYAACGIPDGETIVMTGGYPAHSFVTRCSWELGGAV